MTPVAPFTFLAALRAVIRGTLAEVFRGLSVWSVWQGGMAGEPHGSS